MHRFMTLIILAVALTFGASSLYASDPAPAPSPTEEKDKKPSGPKLIYADDEKKDEKGDKGGK